VKLAVAALTVLIACKKDEGSPQIKVRPTGAAPAQFLPGAWTPLRGEPMAPGTPPSLPSDDVERISIEYQHDWQPKPLVHRREIMRSGSQLLLDGKAIDPRLVGEVLGAASDHQVTAPGTCMGPIDGSDSVRIEIQRVGKPLLSIRGSACFRHAPWRIVEGEHGVTQTSGMLEKPVQALLQAAGIKFGSWDYSDGFENDAMRLDALQPVAFGSDPAWVALVGNTLPSQVRDWCFFAIDPRCEQILVLAQVPYRGVTLDVAAHMRDGRITELTADRDDIAAIDRLVGAPFFMRAFPHLTVPLQLVPSIGCDQDPVFQAMRVHQPAAQDCSFLHVELVKEVAYYPATGLAWIEGEVAFQTLDGRTYPIGADPGIRPRDSDGLFRVLAPSDPAPSPPCAALSLDVEHRASFFYDHVRFRNPEPIQYVGTPPDRECVVRVAASLCWRDGDPSTPSGACGFAIQEAEGVLEDREIERAQTTLESITKTVVH
jgi:hypothetical protein